jgi:hypothetical protein
MSSMSSAAAIGCAVLGLACDGGTRRSTMPQPSPAMLDAQPTPPGPLETTRWHSHPVSVS